MVASWSPHGRLVVTSWPPHGPLMVASWSPHGHLMVTSWSPGVFVGGDFPAVRPVQTRGLRLVVTYMDTPRPLSVFLRRTLDPYGGTRGKSHVYIPPEISDPKIAPSTPRVHLQSTTAVHHCRCRWRCRYHWQGSEESNPELRFWRPLCCHYTRP